MNDIQINHILELYKKGLERNRTRYQKIKDNEDFKIKNRTRAKNHYHDNKEKKQNFYNENKEYINARSSYNYYKKKDRIDDFKSKYQSKYELLIEKKYIIE
tara:strand:+ start:414 stop:716 length:303 start_codon:yes stop_codon:yes gene_type:complete